MTNSTTLSAPAMKKAGIARKPRNNVIQRF